MAFNTSLSGIHAANADLSVTSHNIANVNTVGFKQSRAEFADVFQSTSYGLVRNSIGSGVRLSNVAQQFTQGPVNQTGRSLDLAISGEGFFTLSVDGARVYSRAGNFQPDANGYIINPQGARLQVFAPNADGNGFDVGQLVDLKLGTGYSTPKSTDTVTLGFTLPGNAKIPNITPFDPKESNSYNHSSGGVTIFDSLGVSHVQTSYFVKTANENEWVVHSYVDGNPVGQPTTLKFNGKGELTAPADGKVVLGDFAPNTGAEVMPLTLDIKGSTQYGEAFALREVRKNGYASGKLNEISVDPSGIVYARYSNNADIPLGQVALTNFTNPQGLQQEGGNLWAQTYSSGEPRTGVPNTADFGSIDGGSLEGSGVELTDQLVNMIVAQRNFQANAQMISTQDQVTQTILNLR